jgi:uncharacterized protein (TIGR00369 family)
MRMQPRNPDYRERVRDIVEGAPFIRELGLELEDVGPGWCATRLRIKPRHWQQDAYIHAGVQATVADHTAGSAGYSLLAREQMLLTVEFKVNLLRPATGSILRCRAEVIRAGRTLIVAESAVHAGEPGSERLCAKAMVTLAVADIRS